jgi:diguanylate cyclase (GGDEF)-like protein
MPFAGTFRPSWLCRTPAERSRFLDMHQRLMSLNTFLLVGIVLILLPTAGTIEHPAGLVPVALTALVYGVVQRHTGRLGRPELWIYGLMLATEVGMVVAVVVSHTQHTGALVMVLWTATGIAGRFRTLAVVLATVFGAALITLGQLADGVAGLQADPMRLTLLLYALMSIVAVVTALRKSDVEHRGAALLDPLTGMLNRNALDRRVAEIEQQPAGTADPVALIVLDLDHFKAVNDTHGHSAGDTVLRDVASTIRRELRTSDLAYRIGGEEFAVLLPGATLEHASRRAESLRAAIAEHPLAGNTITASLGVSGTPAGVRFVWDTIYAQADAALYRAKAEGRNRVTADGQPLLAPVAVP